MNPFWWTKDRGDCVMCGRPLGRRRFVHFIDPPPFCLDFDREMKDCRRLFRERMEQQLPAGMEAQAMKQQPRLMRSELTGRVYVVTKYRNLTGPGVQGIEAIDKYDVTDDFDRLTQQLGETCEHYRQEVIALKDKLLAPCTCVEGIPRDPTCPAHQ